MAKHANFQEVNTTLFDQHGVEYPVWIRETKLGQQDTIEVISGWQLSEKELEFFNETGIVFFRAVGGQPPCEILWADPVEFEGQNAVYTHEACYDLPTHRAETVINGRSTFTVTSAWQLNREGREEVRKNGGIIFLRVVGGQPVVEVFGINPIEG
ncbi:hypothetical protein [Spirosoma radiotolerans]|uniref:Uncharacterized protein n=1 Tax=Spirosoma radiotolerans TaxID=1379870 RepID=A0A0E3V6I3_9BACT|nr:hypothetical protein [Spirosoma radiotolerans]AKD55047.1 hypothetical protein SD10_09150 [Spirosoma radiotolerans]